MGVLIFVIAVVLLVALIVGGYNGMVKRRNAYKEAWAQIATQMQKRFDLIPNLVETVKGYAKHESGTFEAVTRARAAVADVEQSTKEAQDDATIENITKVNQQLPLAFKFVREAYPDLKANQNFMRLQETLEHTEESIGAARRLYNDSAMEYNNKIQTFPNNIIAGMFHFTEAELFKIDDEAAAKPVKVSF